MEYKVRGKVVAEDDDDDADASFFEPGFGLDPVDVFVFAFVFAFVFGAICIDWCFPSLRVAPRGTTTNDSIVVMNDEKFSKNRDSTLHRNLIRGDMVAAGNIDDAGTSDILSLVYAYGMYPHV